MRLRATFVLLIAVFPQFAAAQAIRGTVRETRTNMPVAAVRVSVLTGRGSVLAETVSDARGGFVIGWKSSGPIRLKAERLGYHVSFSAPFMMTRPDTVQGAIVIQVSAIPIEPIIVQDQALERDLSGDFAEASRRRALGIGHFIGREQIAQSGATKVSTVLTQLPGIMLQHDAQSPNVIHAMTHWNSSLIGRAPAGNQGAIAPPSGPCNMQLFLDGKIFRMNSIGVDLVPAQDIELIEVYRGLAEVPGIYSGEHARCGVIAIWTKRY